MKKLLHKLVIFSSMFALTGCDLLAIFNHGENNNNNNNNNNNTTTPAVITSVSVEDNKVYKIGDTYSSDGIVVTASYDDNTEKVLTDYYLTVGKITTPLNEEVNKTTPFNRAGAYSVAYRIRVDSKSYFTDVHVDIASGFDTEGYVLQTIEYANTLVFNQDEVVKDRLTNLPLLIHWNHGDEYYDYNINTNTLGISFVLRKEGDGLTDYLETPLEADATYTLILSYQSYNYSYQFTVGGNYYRLNASDITNIQTDLDDDISPSKGNVKMLIIPINLNGNYTDNWTTQSLSNIDGYYFGEDEDKLSLKSYYETASFGQMNVSGLVTEPYNETSTSLTSDLIEADSSMNKLFTLISNAVEYIRSNYPQINLDDYDLNDDGAIDNIHLITNFNTSTYANQTGNEVWSTPLWPHKYQTGSHGTKTSPVANVYSISAINHVKDGVTAIHEQGHIFGLDDYYDYSDSGVDYIGYADMQSYNIFDWNSFSKFTVGWISPYVVTGPTELTIQAASINGDCIVVPADPTTFSNSAFDEYFLIELFSPYGNNAVNYPKNGEYKGSAWSYYSETYENLGNYGVRLYHVNAQLYTWGGSGFVEFDEHITGNEYIFKPVDNNAYNYSRWSYYQDYADYKQLAIIQQGGTDTFGNTSQNVRHFLSGADLFHQGDVFTFNQYKHFLTKTSAVPTTMNNGETFPYKITFTAMSATQTTVKIEYV